MFDSKILIIGYFGCGNFGDNLILQYYQRVMPLMFPKNRFKYVIRDTLELPESFDSEVEFIQISNSLDYLKFLSYECRNSVALLAGGGLISDSSIQSLLYYLLPLYLSQSPSKLTGPIGVNEISNPWIRKLISKLLTTAHVIVRDSDSYRRLNSLSFDRLSKFKVSRLCCPGIMELCYQIQRSSQIQNLSCNTIKMKVGISLRSIKHLSNDNLLNVVVEFANYCIQMGYEIIVYSSCPVDDLLNYQLIKKLNLSQQKLAKTCNFSQLSSLYSKLDFVFSIRIHPALAAFFYEIPFRCLNYDSKVLSLLKTVGVGSLALDLGNLNSSELIRSLNEAPILKNQLTKLKNAAVMKCLKDEQVFHYYLMTGLDNH